MFRSLTILILISSCALFKSQPSLKSKDLGTLLDSMRFIGEGRGRLGIDKQSYVFGYEAFLKENFDWVLAVAIPLQGEEVLVIKDLKHKLQENSGENSFEHRIENELRARSIEPRLTGKIFVDKFRGMIRFIMRKSLNLEASCKKFASHLDCLLDGESYHVSSSDKELFIRSEINDFHYVQLSGQYLTGPIFTRNNFFLFSKEKRSLSGGPLISLELFWKD